MPRKRRLMNQFCLRGESSPDDTMMDHMKGIFQTLENHYRRLHFKALDLVICGIKDCFDQPGYRYTSNLSSFL